MEKVNKLDEIKERWSKATPGPWKWGGDTSAKNIHLISYTKHIPIVMDFVRYGFGNAQPRFNTKNLMYKADELVKYEVDYRRTIMDINHPDAQAIAHSWEDIQFLLSEIERLNNECKENK